MFACNGILFNHESHRRGPTFVTRKITRGLNMILKGERDVLTMGNIDAKRDWGHTKYNNLVIFIFHYSLLFIFIIFRLYLSVISFGYIFRLYLHHP